MDTEEVKLNLIQTESTIAATVAKNLLEFRAKTGISIKTVSINMQEVRSFGERGSEYILQDVSCQIDL